MYLRLKYCNNKVMTIDKKYIKNLDDIFLSAVRIINALPKEGPIDIGISKKLKFYSLYKVSTEGINMKPKPSFWKIEENLKWNAWNSISHINPNEAKYLYLKEFGDTLKDIFLSGKSDAYLSNADMSFMDRISIEDMEILINEAYKDDSTPENTKKEMLNFFKTKILKSN